MAEKGKRLPMEIGPDSKDVIENDIIQQKDGPRAITEREANGINSGWLKISPDADENGRFVLVQGDAVSPTWLVISKVVLILLLIAGPLLSISVGSLFLRTANDPLAGPNKNVVTNVASSSASSTDASGGAGAEAAEGTERYNKKAFFSFWGIMLLLVASLQLISLFGMVVLAYNFLVWVFLGIHIAHIALLMFVLSAITNGNHAQYITDVDVTDLVFSAFILVCVSAIPFAGILGSQKAIRAKGADYRTYGRRMKFGLNFGGIRFGGYNNSRVAPTVVESNPDGVP